MGGEVLMVLAAWIGNAVGCAADGDDTAEPDLPPDETALPHDSTPDTFFVDTSFTDTGFQGTPEHLLTITYEGTWTMSPDGGPYTAMTGALTLTEVLDGNDLEPTCELAYALTGADAEGTCTGCSAAFEVRHYLAEGDPEPCEDPDRPEDGDVWTLGWHRTEETVYYDWQGSGVWIPWFDAEQLGDELTLSWEATVGVAVEDSGT